MKKKFLCFLLAFCMVVCMGICMAINFDNVSVFAEEPSVVGSGNCGGEGDGSNVKYTIYSNGDVIITGSGVMQDWDSFSQSPFEYNKDYVKNVTIGNQVTSIGDNAFYDCGSLETLTFEEGSSLTSIGKSAFYDCESLTSIKIPAGVTSIGSFTFSSCSSLTSIEIPAGVTSIEDYAFYDCGSLATVTFEEGSSLTSIGEGAFESCSSLTSIEIPASVTSIGYGAFFQCATLATVTFEKDASGNTSLASIGNYSFADCNALTAIRFEGKFPTDTIGDELKLYVNNGIQVKVTNGIYNGYYSTGVEHSGFASTISQEPGRNYAWGSNPVDGVTFSEQTASKIVIMFNSAITDPVEIFFAEQLSAPTNLKLENKEGNKLTASWDEVTSGSGYVVQLYKNDVAFGDKVEISGGGH